jgi:uncharacterized membrane protein (DUF485 family)
LAPLHDAPEHDREAEHPEIVSRNTRYGLALFAVYLVFYAVFVVASAFAPAVMERTIGGVNVAVLAGFGLIGAAFLLALVYGWLCRSSLVGRDADGEGGP